MTTPKFSHAAQLNIDETGISPHTDVVALRAGLTAPEKLLADCLDGAENDRVQGWTDYVETCVALATVAK